MAETDAENDYGKMTAEQRSRFESEHFDRLQPEHQTRVALANFDTGRQLGGQEAGIVDKILGNGDGVLDQKDYKKIEDDRNDKAFTDALAIGVSVMAEVARESVYGSLNSGTFLLGTGGSLGGMFNSFAAGFGVSQPQSAPDAAPSVNKTQPDPGYNLNFV